MSSQLGRDLEKLSKDFDKYAAKNAARGAIVKLYSHYENEPVRFITEVLGCNDPGPWSKQVEIAYAVRDYADVTVRSSNSMGKDWLAARLALWWICTRADGLVLMTGPTARQVVTILMRENVRGAVRAAREPLPGLECLDYSARIDGVDRILAFTSSEANKLTGFHKGRILVIVTEAQGVEEFAFEGLSACATGEHDRTILVGNPMRKGGRFYRSCQPNSGWVAFKVTAHEHPNVVQGRTVIPGGPTRAWIAKTMRDELESVARARIDAEFPTESAEALCQMDWIEAATNRDPVKAGPLRLALDVGRTGDACVLVVVRGTRLEEIWQWHSADLMVTVGRVVEHLVRLQVERRPENLAVDFLGLVPTGAPPPGGGYVATIVVDVIGLGAGVSDRLRELGYDVEEFNSGHAAYDNDYLNKRAEHYFRVRNMLEEGKTSGGPWSDGELREELTTIEWQPTTGGKKKMELKKELRTRLGRSPDKADAVVMALGSAGFSPPKGGFTFTT